MLILIWGFILLLAVAVVFLIWFQFKNQADKTDPSVEQNQLQEKVHQLEENLKKTLEIMQDLAKKMHVQQEVIEQTTSKLQKVELQNAELVNILAKAVQPER
ncbi:hypothetical protein MF4642_12140 [Acinetobacter sp. MF4642]|uniref:hypothetical protein n=1 Tax=unclassified Acinetobacter TaxID=196816 RepID=UPI000995202E|nr:MULTISPECIES: hypothetical protein [unclassified Acinetobacter]OOW08948.1 hypothetical protein MF4642_12140 [Acinetobacter sp. MF4642]OOW14954.1 hypothetical protein MF4640_05655 [Acinetobacter sp. MF4640]